MRSDAKSTTFGIAYGETPFSYYAKHGMTLEQAEKLFDDFFRNKPRIKQFIDDVHEQVKKEGFVECLHGFRRNLQDVYSRDSSK
ncbi:DNA polymerase, partial [Streptococcus lutetiensis]|uniref:DNA polymerase n=1 Tax=Streptococcus lutetiensis TaxID=150055 RepID=UPI0035B64396